jgi:hypothetical protein
MTVKYALTLALFVLAAACLAGLLSVPYAPGEPRVVQRVVEETVYVGSNFSIKMLLFFLTGAAGLGGFAALMFAIGTDQSVREEEIRAQHRGR